jgi:DNA-binding SARP family transcriptional activator
LRLVIDDWLELDSREFDRLRVQAKKLDAGGHPARALELYQRAFPLYRDEYMADVPYADWAAVDRHRYERAFLTTAVRAGELLLARGSADTAAALARRAIRIDTAYEPAYRLLAAAHLALGDRSGAHRALAACYARLRHLGLMPESATEMLARRLGPTAVKNVHPDT